MAFQFDFELEFNLGDALSVLDLSWNLGTTYIELDLPFDVGDPDPIEITHELLFNLGSGGIQKVLDLPFNVGSFVWQLDLPFYLGAKDNTITRGAVVNGAFAPGLLVFDKAGLFVGNIEDATISSPPSLLINDTSSAEFYVPRPLFDDGLVADDRLVLFANELGFRWAGTITVQDSGQSQVKVNVSDLLKLWADVDMELDEELADTTKARAVYRRLIDALNVHWAEKGEMRWEAEYNGDNLYHGDLLESGNAQSILQAIATRSRTEWVVKVDVDAGRLVPTIRIADQFSVPGGADIQDGLNVGNVTEPTYTRDAGDVIYAIRLVGERTDIARYAPEWARWAIHEITPEVTVSTPVPADRRHKSVREVSVGWSLSKAQQRALADQTVDRIWQMYRMFLRAWHDEEGYPYHEGFKFSGIPEDLDDAIHTGFGWRTRQKLIEYNGKPASMVFRSNVEKQSLVVQYDRLTGIQTVKRRWDSQTDELYITRMAINGYARFFNDAEGGYLVDLRRRYFDEAHYYVTSAPFTMPYRHEDGKITWPKVRRVIGISEVGEAKEGSYFIMEQPDGPTSSSFPYIRFLLVEKPDNVEAVGVENVYGFELDHVRDWDPRRDGIAAHLNRQSIYNNAVTTRKRWFRVPWGEGGDARTNLLMGINAAADTIVVENIFGFPQHSPFGIILGLDPADEAVKVVHMNNNEWEIERTNPRQHEIGVEVSMANPDVWDGFEWDWTWPEGQAFAEELLAEASQPFERLATGVTNEDGSWATIEPGSLHDVDIGTEGPPPSIDGTWRVMGITPDEYAGELEVLLRRS